METPTKKRLDPKEVELDKIKFRQAEAIFRHLLSKGWNAKGWKPEEEDRYVLQLISPNGEKFSLNGALYYAVTGKNPNNISENNIFGLMKDEGLNMNIFERLQHLASHPRYKGRIEFVEHVIKDELIKK